MNLKDLIKTLYETLKARVAQQHEIDRLHEENKRLSREQIETKQLLYETREVLIRLSTAYEAERRQRALELENLLLKLGQNFVSKDELEKTLTRLIGQQGDPLPLLPPAQPPPATAKPSKKKKRALKRKPS
jgi:hypothetical protein